jgi:hypothetical protein
MSNTGISDGDRKDSCADPRFAYFANDIAKRCEGSRGRRASPIGADNNNKTEGCESCENGHSVLALPLSGRSAGRSREATHNHADLALVSDVETER